ncbi:hypothetical protein E2986_13289 [Frieseomelitta varia]|uniref:Uncharacterized protein n=1 Tax=Frieseomelitta varia TaxID=561572 RepID=A0A833S9F0_9HYME|nr:hypothetical protein E2986_13289 [Frieseomelitta varia]
MFLKLFQAFLIIVDPASSAREQRDVDPKLQYPFSFRGFLTSVRWRSNGTSRVSVASVYTAFNLPLLSSKAIKQYDSLKSGVEFGEGVDNFVL